MQATSTCQPAHARDYFILFSARQPGDGLARQSNILDFFWRNPGIQPAIGGGKCPGGESAISNFKFQKSKMGNSKIEISNFKFQILL